MLSLNQTPRKTSAQLQAEHNEALNRAVDEALVVAPRTDAMFVVVAELVTRRDALAKAADLLSDFTVAGVILNRSSEQMGGDYYGY